jgi:hypothetical protein
MIIQEYNDIQALDRLEHKIHIRKTQLKIALESNMRIVAEALQQQLDELDHNSNFQALMSLFDD